MSQKKGEGKFPIKEEAKKSRRKQKKKRRKIPKSKSGRKKKEGKKIPDQGSKENRGNVQKGHWTRRYLNNTKLSPSKQDKER